MQTPTNRRIEILEHAQSDPSNSIEQVAAYQAEIDAMQTYSNPTRESDPHALPDVEVFYHAYDGSARTEWLNEDNEPYDAGWYWWTCFPGCLPDSEPTGPFATQAEAIANAQNNASNES